MVFCKKKKFNDIKNINYTMNDETNLLKTDTIRKVLLLLQPKGMNTKIK